MKIDLETCFVLALVAAIGVAGCQSFTHWVGPKQDPVSQAAPPVSQLGAPDETYASQWAAGRVTYVGACASCHKPKPIQEFAIDDWKGKIIPRMSLKAKLTPEQTLSLEEYVMAVKRFQLVGNGPGNARLTISPVSAADNR